MSDEHQRRPGPAHETAEGAEFPQYADHYPATNPYGREPTNAELQQRATPQPPPSAQPPTERPKRRSFWPLFVLPWAVVAFAGWASGAVDGFGADEVTAPVTAPVTSIEITASTQDVEVRVDDSLDAPTVTADERRAGEDFAPTVTDGVLTVSGQDLGDVTITVPADSEVPIEITSSTGSVDLEDVPTPELSVQTSTGAIELEDVAAGSYNLRTTTGDITGTISEAPESGQFSTTTGDVELEFPDEPYQVTTDTNTGDVDNDLTQGDGPPLDVTTTTGDIDLDD